VAALCSSGGRRRSSGGGGEKHCTGQWPKRREYERKAHGPQDKDGMPSSWLRGPEMVAKTRGERAGQAGKLGENKRCGE